MRNKKAVLAAGIAAAALLCAALVFANMGHRHSANESRVVTVESAVTSDAGSYVTEEKGSREAGKSGTGTAAETGSASASGDNNDENESMYSDYQSSYPDGSLYDDRVNAKNYGDPNYKILKFLNFVYDSDEAQSANQQMTDAFSVLGIDLAKYPDAGIEAGPAYSNVSRAATTYRSCYVTIDKKTYTVIMRMPNASNVPHITIKEGKVSDDDLKQTADSAQDASLSSIPVTGVPAGVLQTLGLSADNLAKGIAEAEQKAGASYTSLAFSEIIADTPERYTIEVTLDNPSDLRTIRVSLNRATGDITYIP